MARTGSFGTLRAASLWQTGTGGTFSNAFWVNPKADGLMVVNGNNAGTIGWGFFRSGSNFQVACFGNLGDSYQGLSLNTWYHIAVTTSGTTWHVYVNGAEDAASPKTRSYSNPSGGFSGFYDSTEDACRIADHGFWSGIALTAQEAAGLARGARPWQVRESSLTAYYPIDGDTSPEPDLSGSANNLTVTGTSKFFGPPMSLFVPKWSISLPPPPPPPLILMPQIVT